MHDLGLIDVIHPDKLSPDVLSGWLAQDIKPPKVSRELIDLDGLSHLYRLVRDALATHPDPARLYFH
jgi:predicted glycosyltransferase